MSDYFPFLVVGLVSGAVYALASMGLVLTYTTSGVFNFAHGAVGMFATYIFYSLRVDVGLPTALAAAVAILLVAPVMGILIDQVLLRRLEGAPAAAFVVASLGLLVGLQSLAVALYGGANRQVAPIFPTSTYRLAGVNVGVDQTLVVLIAVTAGIALAAFFSKTHIGLMTRAVVGDKDLAGLVGTNTSLVTSFSWMLGCAFAALSGILFSPFVSLDSLLLTLLVVQAFGATVVGRLRSLPLTNLGAYGIGIAAALTTKLIASQPGLAGLPSAVPFIVLFAVLVLSPKGSFVEATRHQVARTAQRSRARLDRLPVKFILPALAVYALSPALVSNSQLFTLTTAAAFFLIFSSLGLLVGLSRQVSLCHAVFVVFGATTMSHLLSAGVPYVLALLLAGLVIVPVGALLAIPAIRLSGLFLALATFGFGVLAQNLLFPTGLAFGKDSVALVARPSFATGDVSFFYFVVAVAAVCALAMELVRVSRLGRLLRSLGDSPTAVQSLGINPMASQVLVFCVSAFFAAIAGGLLGSLVKVLNPGSFNFYQSLVWLAVIVTCGTQTFGGRVLAIVLFVIVPAVFTSSTVTEWQPVFFGVAAMLLAQAPNGLAGLLFRRPDFATLAQRSAWRADRRRGVERYVAAVAGRAH